jgi:NAD-dependent deacetylase
MDILNEALKIIKDSKYLVALTGAGASTESNIPDFRSAHGLYNKDSGNEIPPNRFSAIVFL